MKINRLIFFLFVGVILSGVITGVFILGGEMNAVPVRIDQSQALTNESYASASISKETILLLLVVGVIGALGVSRQKKDSGSDSDLIPADRAEQHVDVNEDPKKLITRDS
jgi:hypothetical protein